MTTEDDFHRALDANIDDWQTRLVFADWLQERGDPRAEGYRALGLLRRRPHCMVQNRHRCHWFARAGVECPGTKELPECQLPTDWFSAITYTGKTEDFIPLFSGNPDSARRGVEDAAALGFAQLP